jgi:hypothetical protein
MPTGYSFTTISWHRKGTGVSKPNPAERTTVITPITASASGAHFPQVACSITFRTGVRKSWGRTYLPLNAAGVLSNGSLPSGQVDAIAGATNTLMTSAASSDFHLVVVSSSLASSLNIEKIEVDDVTDVIRRRRWKSATYKKILP